MKKMYKAIISIALALSMILQLGAASVCAVENNPPVVPSEEDASGVSIVKLQTEFMDNPLGIDIESPRLSWQMKPSAEMRKPVPSERWVRGLEPRSNCSKKRSNSGGMPRNISEGIPPRRFTVFYVSADILSGGYL